MSRARSLLGGCFGGVLAANSAPPAPPLPYDYQVTYLLANGNQYIDTGVKATNKAVIICDYQKTSTANNGLYGNVTGQRVSNFTGLATNRRFGGNVTVTVTDDNTNRHTSTQSSAGFKLDSTLKAYSGVATFTTGANIWLFGINGSSDPKFAGYVYSYQHSEDGELVVDFIPVVDKQGVACMYDRVSGTLFYNSGSGSFTPGSRV